MNIRECNLLSRKPSGKLVEASESYFLGLRCFLFSIKEVKALIWVIFFEENILEVVGGQA